VLFFCQSVIGVSLIWIEISQSSKRLTKHWRYSPVKKRGAILLIVVLFIGFIATSYYGYITLFMFCADVPVAVLISFAYRHYGTQLFTLIKANNACEITIYHSRTYKILNSILKRDVFNIKSSVLNPSLIFNNSSKQEQTSITMKTLETLPWFQFISNFIPIINISLSRNNPFKLQRCTYIL